MMSKRHKLIVALCIYSLPAQAADTLKVSWDDEQLQEARTARTDLLSADNGFEASGSSAVAQAKLPVLGLLPAAIGAVFSVSDSGFEDAPKVPADYHTSALKVVPATDRSRLSYSISYSNIASGLDAYCSGTRTVRSLPKGLPSSAGIAAQADDRAEKAEDDDELHFIQAQVVKFGIPYKCVVYCSNDQSKPYCKTPRFAQEMLANASILTPGQRD